MTPNSPNYDFEISMECELLLRKQSEQVGPHNVCECSTHSTGSLVAEPVIAAAFC